MSANNIQSIVKLDSEIFENKWSENTFRETLENTTQYLFQIEMTGKAIGFICFSVVNKEVELLKIGVDREFRKKGIAQNLFDFLLHYLKTSLSLESFDIFLEVKEDNLEAKKFYFKNSFKEFGKRKNYYKKSGKTALLMKREFIKT